MSRGGVLSKAWDRLRSLLLQETFVGADANGNKYYRLVAGQVACIGDHRLLTSPFDTRCTACHRSMLHCTMLPG
jgi:hypothetical protein